MHGQKKILEDRRGGGRDAAAASRGGGDENDATNKPLATALMQEFQQLKDKFKSEDGEGDKGFSFLFNFSHPILSIVVY